MVSPKFLKSLSLKKKAQLDRFFSDPSKVSRLLRGLEKNKRIIGRTRQGQPNVFDVLIMGKRRALKLGPSEVRARKAVLLVSNKHELALRSGEIKATKYKLARLKYDFANSQVGVMEKVPGIGADSLRKILSGVQTGASKEVFFSKFGEMGGRVFEFLKENPQITKETLALARIELTQNINQLFEDGYIKDFDLQGTDNVIVRAFDKKSGKLVLTLIDHVYPFR
jgi:hypothetical protein